MKIILRLKNGKYYLDNSNTYPNQNIEVIIKDYDSIKNTKNKFKDDFNEEFIINKVIKG